jgi:Arc/MetJ-type ribon-helix-helix transcriptional regulator
MKVSLSLPEGDVAYVDSLAKGGQTSRSAVVHQAIQSLRQRDLAAEYAAAFTEWVEDGHAAAWEPTVADGLAE